MLRRRLWPLGGLYVAGLLLALLITRAGRVPSLPPVGLVCTGIALAYQGWFVASRLGDVRRPGQAEVYPGFGPGTWATLVRGTLLAVTAGFLFSPRPPGILAWAPTILFTTAELLDYLDGYLARASGQPTVLGEALDLELDALGMLVGSALAVWYRTLPWPFLAFGLARYGFAAGLWLRRARGLPVQPLPASDSRRPIAGLAMGYLSAMLWPIVEPPGTTVAGLLFLLPFLASFGRDWAASAGWISEQDIRYQRLRGALRSLLLRWIPLPLRAAVLVAAGPALAAKFLQYETQVAWYAGLGFPSPGTVVSAFALLEAVGLLLMLTGAAGRIGAFVMVFPLGFTIVAASLSPDRSTALVATLGILILGTGRFSLWHPEAALLPRRGGRG